MIHCDFYDYNLKKWNQYEIDIESNFYPCCFFYLDKEREGKLNDAINHIDISLKSNTMDNIIVEYDKIFNEKTWSGDKCPQLCLKSCRLN